MKNIGVSKAIWRELNKIRREHDFKYHGEAIDYLLEQSTAQQPSIPESDLKQPNKEEENKKATEEKHLLNINKIRGIARFIADRYYNGQYTMEKYTQFQYRFGFGIAESGDIHMFVGKTLTEVMYRAINFELTANDRLGIIRNERQKSKKLEDILALRDARYAEIIKEKDNKIIATEKECRGLTKESKDLEVLIGEQTTIIEENKQKIKELQDNLAWKETQNATLTKEKAEEKREERLPVETLLLKGRTIYTVRHHNLHRRISENVWNDMKNTIMDGDYHTFPEMERFLRKYWGPQPKNRSMEKVRNAYFFYAREIKHYPYEREMVGKRLFKFRFGVKKHGLEKERVLATVGNNVNILEPLWNDLQDSTMDGEWHAFSEANEIIMRHGYRQVTMGRILQIRKSYFRFAKDEKYHLARGGKDYLFEWKRIDGIYKFRFEKKQIEGREEAEPERHVEEEEKGLPLGKEIGSVGKNKIFENPWNEFERVFCDGNEHPYSEPNGMFRKYERYNKYILDSLCSLRVIYLRHARKYYRKERPPGHKAFRLLPIEERVEERIEEKEKKESKSIVI